jgi:hypothetical protein
LLKLESAIALCDGGPKIKPQNNLGFYLCSSNVII